MVKRRARKVNNKLITKFIDSPISSSFLFDFINFILHRKELWKWIKKGLPMPLPHLEKQKIIKEYSKKFSIDTFI